MKQLPSLCMDRRSGYAPHIMTKAKNHDVLKPQFWYKLYMFDDVRTVILPNGDYVPLPHEDFDLGSFAVALCKDKIREDLFHQ